jgi:predicted secreted protein
VKTYRIISFGLCLAIITILATFTYRTWQIKHLSFAVVESADAAFNNKTHRSNNTTALNSSVYMKKENITIKKGEEFALHFESNPTTGYEWSPVFNESIINLISHKFKPSSSFIGAGGKDNFIFKGISHGTTSLEMLYKRSWEKDFVKEKMFLVNVD